MTIEYIKSTVRRYPKSISSIGIATTCGIIIYEGLIKRDLLEYYLRRKSADLTNNNSEYVYIKYHIHRESLRELKRREEADKRWISVVVNPIGKFWEAGKLWLAQGLLHVAQKGDQEERYKAVHQLTCLKRLKDWDFCHLAQSCDSRTAISLARSGADLRWFQPPHMRGVIKNTKIVLSELHDMLSRLPPKRCINHFFSKYFPEPDPIDETPEGSLPLSAQDTDLLKEIIAFLHHISKEEAVAAEILKERGLVQLMELQKIFANDNETLTTLCKVLANISLVEDAGRHFFSTGWIRVLAEWQQGPDLRLQVIAAKAMANLDRDDPNHQTYPPNIYPLHPRERMRRKPKADVIFIHGLLGGVFITWRQRDRTPTELGLYGKNAFYTSEAENVFLVGEHKRGIARRLRNLRKEHNADGDDALLREENIQTETTENYNNNNREIFTEHKEESLLKPRKKIEDEPLDISDIETKEFVENLRSEAELGSDWEVVHPDVPLSSSKDCKCLFSVSGEEWKNQESEKEYTNCWPMEWLPEDYPDARVIGIDYTSALTEWSVSFTKYCPCEKGQGQIDTRASNLLERLTKADVGNNRPVIWIGHSMGGLITKLILLKSIDSADPAVSNIAKNTRGIVFLGTPHRGSPIAKWKQHMQMILSPSIEVKDMEENSTNLLLMHKRFMNCLLGTCLENVKIVSVAEGSPTMLTTFKFPLQIVTEESARIDYGDYYLLKDDHLSLSKPIFKQSFLYQRVLDVINESLTQGSQPKEKDSDDQRIVTQSKDAFGKLLTISRNFLSYLPRFVLRFT